MRISPLAPLVLAIALTPLFTGKSLGADPYEPEFLQGSYFYHSSSGSVTISPTAGAYTRFTATETTNATSVSINLNNSGLTATSITFGLQADDGTGKPNGTFLASGSVTPASGWNTVTFGSGVQLTAGQVYHVVAAPATGGNALLRFLTGVPLVNVPGQPDAPATNFQSYGIIENNYIRGLTNASGTPTGTPVSTGQMIFAVGTESRGIGFAYQGATIATDNSTLLTTTAPLAQRFQFTPSASDQTVLESFTLRLSAGANNLSDVRISLLNDADEVIADTTLLGTALTASVTADYTVTFDDEIVLTEGSYYKLALYAETTSTVRWMAGNSSSSSDSINSATFQGLDGYAFKYDSLDFSNPGDIRFSHDHTFSYTTSAIPEPSVALSLLLGIGVAGILRRKTKA